MDKIAMYIASHKNFKEPNQMIYKPILVGSVTSKLASDTQYLRDDIGDNISEKNPYYCELTALYWIWKHGKEDIIGLCHYRRYFFKKSFTKDMNDILSERDIQSLLTKNDIILPKKMYFYRKNNKEQYLLKHDYQVLRCCREVIEYFFADYVIAFDMVLDQNYLYCFNMFVMRKEVLNQYCEWLYKICFELEKRLIIEHNYEQNARIIGYVSERLFNVWLLKNKSFKVKELPVYNIESNYKRFEIENKMKHLVHFAPFIKR